MMVSRLMTEPVIRIDENSTCQEATEMMGKQRIGSLLVTRRGEDIGIITERDIISKVIAEKGNLEIVKVKDVMSTPLILVNMKTTGEDALRIMAKNGVRRLPIMDKEKIVGIFTTSDITKLAILDS